MEVGPGVTLRVSRLTFIFILSFVGSLYGGTRFVFFVVCCFSLGVSEVYNHNILSFTFYVIYIRYTNVCLISSNFVTYTSLPTMSFLSVQTFSWFGLKVFIFYMLLILKIENLHNLLSNNWSRLLFFLH